MSEPQDGVRHSRCGCVHGPEGNLVTCPTHLGPEQRMWHRPDPDGPDFPPHTGPRETCVRCPQLPPEQSLCGEEEALAAGSFGDPPDEAGPPALDHAKLVEWERHCRGVGRNRATAYADALRLAQMQFEAWQGVFPGVADTAFRARGLPLLNQREQEILMYYSAGFAAFLRDTLQIAQRAAERR